MNGFWNIVWLVFWAFAFVAYLMVLFTILVDLFRDDQLNGWWKAIWVIFLIFVPFLTALVYLIARGRGMALRNQKERQTVAEDTDYYTHPTPSKNPAADIEQAALVHGARPIQVFWHVTLPLLRPGLLAGAIFGFLMSFDEVSVALLLTDTNTTTLPVMILSFLVNNNDPSVAAVCTIQMLIAVGTLVVLERLFGVRNLMFSAR